MKIQNCRRKGYSDLSFMDPTTCNCRLLRDNPDEIFQNLYKYFAVQHDKFKILFPYNFADHWILLVIIPEFSLVIVMDSLRRDPQQYKDHTDMLKSVWKKIVQNHKGNYSQTLKIKTDFSCMRQAQGTNLCAYLSMYKQGTKDLLVYIHIEHAQASWSSEVLSRMAVRSREDAQ
ncbi:uncharacterized protein LOC120655220 [Panicum virgatum]|uniref:uncharacterized protein LOC120655220 n=1 Tax=Panicum virgatum TaxID=38727 RepID=UPI0019D65834|nr:uncharacterized protein LOC120655220 [Panicum virgatum]